MIYLTLLRTVSNQHLAAEITDHFCISVHIRLVPVRPNAAALFTLKLLNLSALTIKLTIIVGRFVPTVGSLTQDPLYGCQKVFRPFFFNAR
jgi:hypothetical protein